MKALGVVLVGAAIGAAVVFFTGGSPTEITKKITGETYSPRVIGFLPYWNISSKDYSPYIDTIAYFSLTVLGDGTIQKETNPGEAEPGYYALGTKHTQINPTPQSLVVFAGDQEEISILMESPEEKARTMMGEIIPIMKKYSFTDLNIDIESVSVASPSAQQRFTRFLETVDEELSESIPTATLSIDVSPTALILPYLIDVKSIAPYVDTVIFMTYDFHYSGSLVSGPVAPLGGVKTVEEYDVETSVQQALRVLPPEKIYLGVPLYGYQWETLSPDPRSATVPGTGITASSKRVAELLDSCATCSAQFDDKAAEAYLVYRDEDTGTYIHIFYPDQQSIEARISLAKKYRLGGMALWALGYEDRDLFEMLSK